jgi:hypothetical protein
MGLPVFFPLRQLDLAIITNHEPQGFRASGGDLQMCPLSQHTVYNPLVNALHFGSLQNHAMLEVSLNQGNVVSDTAVGSDKAVFQVTVTPNRLPVTLYQFVPVR